MLILLFLSFGLWGRDLVLEIWDFILSGGACPRLTLKLNRVEELTPRPYLSAYSARRPINLNQDSISLSWCWLVLYE